MSGANNGMSDISAATRKALQCLVDHGGEMGCARFSEAMNYGRPGCAHRTKGMTGASVLKRLQKLGYVTVWDDWFKNSYCTVGTITKAGRDALLAVEGEAE